MSDGDIIREVEEELRREKLEKLWQKYQTLIAGVAIAIVIGVAGYKGWQSWQLDRAATAGGRFEEAQLLLRDGKAEDAAKVLESFVAQGPSGYRALARFKLAGEAAAAGKTDEALAHYSALAEDGGTGGVLKGLASLETARLMIDREDFTAFQNRLTALTEPDNPWRHLAWELLGLAAYKARNFEEAEKNFSQVLADAEVPQGLRRRVEMMMSLIVADTAKPAGG